MFQGGLTKSESGFTLVEMVIVMIVIAILFAIALSTYGSVQERARESRAQTELRSVSKAALLYMIAESDIPADTARGIPPGFEQYLTNKDWPNGPYGESSVYDWDNYVSGGEAVLQVSLRFCENGLPDTCNFPQADWADSFGVNSAMYYCIFGPCKPHASEADDYPGLCVNCTPSSSALEKTYTRL